MVKALLVFFAVAFAVGAVVSLIGAYTIKDGINQATEWQEQQKKEKESWDNAEL